MLRSSKSTASNPSTISSSSGRYLTSLLCFLLHTPSILDHKFKPTYFYLLWNFVCLFCSSFVVQNVVLSISIYVNHLFSSDYFFFGTILLIIIKPLRRTPLLAQCKGAKENLSCYKELNQVYAKKISRLYKRVK